MEVTLLMPRKKAKHQQLKHRIGVWLSFLFGVNANSGLSKPAPWVSSFH